MTERNPTRDRGESIITARLRRLREEADAEPKILFGNRPDPLTSPSDSRKPAYRPMEVQEETLSMGKDEHGDFQIRREVFKTSVIANGNAGPFENIIAKGWILRKGEELSMREIRIKTAHRFRSTYEGAQVSALKGQSYEVSTGRAGVPGPVADGVIDCIRAMEAFKAAVPATDFEAIESVVCRDQWIWEGKAGGAIAKEVDRVLRGLDHLAARFGYLTREDVMERWPDPRLRRSLPDAG